MQNDNFLMSFTIENIYKQSLELKNAYFIHTKTKKSLRSYQFFFKILLILKILIFNRLWQKLQFTKLVMNIFVIFTVACDSWIQTLDHGNIGQ